MVFCCRGSVVAVVRVALTAHSCTAEMGIIGGVTPAGYPAARGSSCVWAGHRNASCLGGGELSLIADDAVPN
jgi:hypothetical protein